MLMQELKELPVEIRSRIINSVENASLCATQPSCDTLHKSILESDFSEFAPSSCITGLSLEVQCVLKQCLKGKWLERPVSVNADVHSSRARAGVCVCMCVCVCVCVCVCARARARSR